MSLAMLRLAVLDGFEDGAALAAAVLKRHRLRPEQGDHLSVPRRAVRAAGVRSRLVSRRWAARTSSPPGHAACRKCGRRSRLYGRACALRPIASSRLRFAVLSFPSALRGVLSTRPGPC